MRLLFLGADHEVTGSCHYLRVCGKHILIDCGMEQGNDVYENQELPIPSSEIDFVFLTHAHIDHSGLIPLLYTKGFRGKVYCTKPTKDLCEIMLKDSAHIQMFEAEWRNRKAKRSNGSLEQFIPLYDMDAAVNVMNHFVGCPYDSVLDISEGIRIRFTDAGHLLGSASIEIWVEEEEKSSKIVFSGDIGNINKPIIKDPQYIKEADYVVMESTYGTRQHGGTPDYVKELAAIFDRTFKRGGNVVIPSFAVGRTQELLYFIRKIKEDKKIDRDFDVYLDSPLAIESTNIFNKNIFECFDEDAMKLINEGINPLTFPGLRLATTGEASKQINFDNNPKVIISASGMCEAGRIRHHLKHNLWRKDSTILFVGYQVHGTLGNLLLGGAKEVKLFGESIEVHAKIQNLAGISGHADQQHLLEWVKAFGETPKRIFVVHGEDSVCDTFASLITKETGVEAIAPYSGDIYDLETNTCLAQGSREKKVKKTKDARVVSNVFARLLAAGERLLAVIRKSEGRPNKELGKLADQINSICDKWE